MREYYGEKSDRVALIVPGSRWVVRKLEFVQPAEGRKYSKYPGASVKVLGLGKIDGLPAGEWRVVYQYETGKITKSNSSVHSFLGSFREENETPNAQPPIKAASEPTLASLTELVGRLHHRVVHLTNSVLEVRKALGMGDSPK